MWLALGSVTFQWHAFYLGEEIFVKNNALFTAHTCKLN